MSEAAVVVENQLEIIEQMKPAELFASGTLDTILAKIAEQSRAADRDISTAAGRKKVASLAYKIAQSKTFLDDCGKKLGEDSLKVIQAINADRKKAKDFLQSLQDDIRKPLTEWENKEKSRIAEHEAELIRIANIGTKALQDWQSVSRGEVTRLILEVTCIERDWEEFALRGEAALKSSICKLEAARDKIDADEAQKAEHAKAQAELAQLRAEAEARRVKDREEQIAKEAAEKARAEAVALAKAEADRIAAAELKERQRILDEKKAIEEKAEKDRIAAEAKAKADAAKAAELEEKARQKILAEKKALEEKAENDRQLAEAKAKAAEELAARNAKALQDAQEKAERDRLQAIDDERARVEAERVANEAERKKREADEAHREWIEAEIFDDVRDSVGLSPDDIKRFIRCLKRGEIRNLQIVY